MDSNNAESFKDEEMKLAAQVAHEKFIDYRSMAIKYFSISEYRTLAPLYTILANEYELLSKTLTQAINNKVIDVIALKVQYAKLTEVHKDISDQYKRLVKASHSEELKHGIIIHEDIALEYFNTLKGL